MIFNNIFCQKCCDENFIIPTELDSHSIQTGGKTLAISDKNLATFVNTNLAYLSVRLDCYFCTKNEAGHAICWVEWQLKLTDDLR